MPGDHLPASLLLVRIQRLQHGAFRRPRRLNGAEKEVVLALQQLLNDTQTKSNVEPFDQTEQLAQELQQLLYEAKKPVCQAPRPDRATCRGVKHSTIEPATESDRWTATKQGSAPRQSAEYHDRLGPAPEAKWTPPHGLTYMRCFLYGLGFLRNVGMVSVHKEHVSTRSHAGFGAELLIAQNTEFRQAPVHPRTIRGKTFRLLASSVC